MNQTLFLAEKILTVLNESSDTLESQRKATEIAAKVLQPERRGALSEAVRAEQARIVGALMPAAGEAVKAR